MLPHIIRCTIIALTAILLAGCGQSGGPALLPVEGKVNFNGNPLTKGSVILHPDKGKGNTTPHEPRGQIDADGHYQVMTHPNPGAPPGPQIPRHERRLQPNRM